MNHKKFVLTLSSCLLSVAMSASQTSTAMSSSSSSSSSSTAALASMSALSSSSSSSAHSTAGTTLRKRHTVLQTDLSSLGTLNLNSEQLQKAILRSCDGMFAPIFLGSAGLVSTTAGACIMASSPAGSIVLLALGAGYFTIAGFCGITGRNTNSTRASKRNHKSE